MTTATASNYSKKLTRFLHERFPQYEVIVDAPELPSGHWFINVISPHGNGDLVIEWSDDHIFGLSQVTLGDPNVGYGEKSEEAFNNIGQLEQRIEQLLLQQSHITPVG